MMTDILLTPRLSFWVDPDNRIHMPGVCYGYGDSDPRVVARFGRFWVVRKPGASDWSCIGSSAYHGAEWAVVEVVPEDRDSSGRERWRALAEFEYTEPGRRWQAAKARLIEVARKKNIADKRPSPASF
jgi:hypothetical protein